jgi:hypothetical protein
MLFPTYANSYMHCFVLFVDRVTFSWQYFTEFNKMNATPTLINFHFFYYLIVVSTQL